MPVAQYKFYKNLLIVAYVTLLIVLLHLGLYRGAQKLTGENLKPVWAKFSTISQDIMMMCTYASMWTHTHVYSWKLGPGFVLLAKVCQWLYTQYGLVACKCLKIMHATNAACCMLHTIHFYETAINFYSCNVPLQFLAPVRILEFL